MSSAQGGQAAPSSNCAGQQAQVHQVYQLLQEKFDDELKEHQEQLRELMTLYNQPHTTPTIRDQIHRHLIRLFVTPGLAVIDRLRLKMLFSVSPFTQDQGLTEAEYDRHVQNFIDNKCLKALTELLTLPKLFNLVFELFLNFFYGKSKVRMAIAALNGSAHLVAAVSAAVPIVKTSVQSTGVALNIMFYLFQFVNNPTDFLKEMEMERGVVQDLLKSIPFGDVALSAFSYVVDAVGKVAQAAITPLVLTNIVSEAILMLLEYVSGLPAPAAPAAAQPAAAPNAPVSLVWRGGQWMLTGVGASIAYIRQHITQSFNPSVARLSAPENAYKHRLITCMLNNLTLMSDSLNTQAGVAFTQEEADGVRATVAFNALLPSNYRLALEEGNMDDAYTERLMFLAALKMPVAKLCSQREEIDVPTLNIIAPWVRGIGEITADLLTAFVKQLPLPRYVNVPLSDSMEAAASQDDNTDTRDLKVQADLAKWLNTNKPLTPVEQAKKIKAGITFFGAPAAVTSTVVSAALRFYDYYLAPPCRTMFNQAHSFLDPGVRPNAVCRLGPLHPNKVIMSGVEHIVQKQLREEKLSNDEAILLNSYLNIWSGDPNKLSYGKRKYKDGTTGYCWFLHLGTTIYVIKDDEIKRDQPNHVFDDSMFGRAVRIVGDFAGSCSAAAADSAMSGASAVANTGLGWYNAVMKSLGSSDAPDDNAFSVKLSRSGFNVVPLKSVPQAAALPVPDLHDDAAARAVDAGGEMRAPKKPKNEGGKSRRKSRKNSKKTTRRNKGSKSSNTAKKSQQQRARNSIRRRRSSRKGRK